MITDTVENTVDMCISDEVDSDEWDLVELNTILQPIIPVKTITKEDVKGVRKNQLKQNLLKQNQLKQNQLKKKMPQMPVELVDERFTSVLAHQAMLTGGLKKKDRQNKALVDEISATIILQSYMESRKFKL